MKKIFHILLTVLAGASVVSCQNYLSANSPSTVDADFVFSSFETGKTVMLGAYNQVTNSFTSGLPTNFDDIGSDTDRCSVGMVAALCGAAQLYGGQPSYVVESYNINDGNVPGGNWNTFYSYRSGVWQPLQRLRTSEHPQLAARPAQDRYLAQPQPDHQQRYADQPDDVLPELRPSCATAWWYPYTWSRCCPC